MSTDEILAKIAAVDMNLREKNPDAEAAFAEWQQATLALPRTEWHALELYQLGDSGQKYWPLPDKSAMNMGYANTRGTSFSPPLWRSRKSAQRV